MLLASFDIFDTALFRKCGKPDGVFFILSQLLFPNNPFNQESFYIWRIKRESDIAQRKSINTINLDDIYEDPLPLFLSERPSSYYKSIEKDCEVGQLIANPPIKQLINDKRNAGYTICFISDMYLDSRFIKEILIREGCASESDSVFVSNELGKRKSDGSLFSYIQSVFSPDKWEHYGDNTHSDYSVPIKHGIDAHLVAFPYTPYEKEIAKRMSSFREKRIVEILAGASRSERILLQDTPTTQLAADVIAPVYIPFIQHVLEQARTLDIKRLYFLARDGFIFFRIAKSLLKSEDSIELKYLYISRKVLQPAFIAAFPTPEIFLQTQWGKTIARNLIVDNLLSSQFKTSREELIERFKIDIPYERIDDRIKEKDFLDKMFNSNYTPSLLERTSHDKSILLDYLYQEGLLDDVRIAMVDVGWLGTTRMMINKLLEGKRKEEILFFYYGAEEKMIGPEYGKYTVFNPAGKYPIPLVERYFSAAPHGSTVGYKLDASLNTIVPITSPLENDADISNTNIRVVEGIASTLFPIIDSIPTQVLYSWGHHALELISEGNTVCNLTPLCQIHPQSASFFFFILNLIELLRIVFLDSNVTDFNKGSIQVSIPHWLFGPVWKLHNRIAHIHMALYRRIKRR